MFGRKHAATSGDQRFFLYVVYDKIGEQWGPIVEAVNDGVALRDFSRFKASLDDISKEDYKLFCVGAREGGVVQAYVPFEVQVKLEEKNA